MRKGMWGYGQMAGEEDASSLLQTAAMERVSQQQLVDTLRTPLIHLKSCRVKHTVWQIFKAHHYLIDTMHQAARCTLFVWQQVALSLSGSTMP